MDKIKGYINLFDESADLYQYMVGLSYSDYIDNSVERILSFAEGAETVLSVGCGNGDIEAKLSGRFDLTVYDTHNAALENHPDLHWVSDLPNGQFDYVYAHGSVFACIPQDEKQKFIDDISARVRDGGTLYICEGNSKPRSACRGRRAITINGHVVTEYVTKRGEGWNTVTTHIWGKAKVDITYYPADVKDFLSDHSARIRCVVGGRNIHTWPDKPNGN